MHGNQRPRSRVIPTPLVIPPTEYQTGNKKRKIQDNVEDESSIFDDFWSFETMQPSDLISPLTPTQTSDLSRDTSIVSPESVNSSIGISKFHQRFHLWQNLDTGECQYRLANVGQRIKSHSSFPPLYYQAVRPSGYSICTPKLQSLTSVTPSKS